MWPSECGAMGNQEGILANVYTVVRRGLKIIDHRGRVADIVAFSKFGIS